MAARQELHSGLSEMATQTQNYKLNKFELKDAPADITAINASMDIIDTQLKALADGKFDKTGGTISGNLVVNGSTTLKKLTASELDLNGNADVSGTLKVAGATTLTGKLTANGGVTTKALTATNLDLNGNGDVSGSLTVHGDLNAQGGLNVTDITATGATTLVNLNAANITATGTLKVNGATTLTGLLAANGGVTTKKVTATELDLNGNGDVSGNLNVGGLLQVTGSAQLNGGGTVKTPTSNVNDTSIINANWAWNLMRSYGLGAGLGTAPSYTGALNDLDTTGFYTLSGTYADGPAGMQTITGQILHMQRRFAAGTVAFQLLPYSNTIRFRTKNQDTWGGWNTAATQEWTQEQISGLTTLTDDGVKVISPADYNTLTSPGFYHCNQTNQANGPGKANKLIVLAQPGDTPKHITQLTLPISNTEKLCPAVRYMDANGNWSDWFKLALVDSNETLRASSLWLTASSMIKYPGASSNSIPNFGFEVEDYVKGDDLSKAINARYLVYAKDQSGVAVGALGGMIVGVEQTKKTWARLYAYRNQNGVATADYIGILANPDGTYETRSPHPVTESNDNSIATTKWVRDLLLSAVPTGTILPFAGKTVPSGFLSCNKANVSRTTYAKLFSIIGTTYGSGDGSTTFTLPDYRNRFVMGANTASEVGTYLESGAPNITGWHGGHAYKSNDHNETGGAFYGMDERHGGAGATTNCDVWKMGFDASLSSPIYGASDIIQPPAGKALWIIKT